MPFWASLPGMYPGYWDSVMSRNARARQLDEHHSQPVALLRLGPKVMQLGIASASRRL